MKINHFQKHKQKYIGFLAVAFLVTSGTYMVYRTEALNFPFGDNPIMSNSRPCPPIFRRIHRAFPPNHPCFENQEETNSVPNSPTNDNSSTAPVDTSTTTSTSSAEDTSTSTASSTSSSDEGTSTVSTSTPDDSAPAESASTQQ